MGSRQNLGSHFGTSKYEVPFVTLRATHMFSAFLGSKSTLEGGPVDWKVLQVDG